MLLLMMEKIFGKKARFNVLSIDAKWNYSKNIYERLYFIADISIQEIPKDDLIQLKEFIGIERLRNSLFCKTIYNAVIEELYLRKNNTDTVFFREINRIEDKEKKIRLIQPDKQSEYRRLLVSINGIKQKLNAPTVDSGHYGWTHGFNQNSVIKKNYGSELYKLLKEKEEIERNFSVSTN